MDGLLPPFVLQFVGSLAAILAIVWLVRRMGLGAQPVLGSEEAVLSAAAEVEDGFVATTIALDRRGQAALAKDPAGKIMVLRPHGGHFAGRVLGAGARATISGEGLTVDCGERVFGAVTLNIDEPKIWTQAINRLSGADNA